ncbi:hypothetical protein ACQU0X_25675 [Pseudovibrio ascidiaceicola]|uniref:hypothetical protein n=1 Tax=Pseudovibrio ascidiaceicola TaxID=285279 RepID=UPI003D3642C3
MTTNAYRPEVGKTIFVSLFDNAPILITVTGYRYHSYLKEDVIEFTRKNGESGWTSLDNNTFYHEVPVDTKYLYFLISEYSNFMESSEEHEEGFFFTPEEAFTHLQAIETGEVKPNYTSSAEFQEYFVEVREVD